MADENTKNGYIILSRSLIDSDIFSKPPLYLKVWIYLLNRAQHKDFKNLVRGQLYTSIPEIQEACSYYVGFRKETPTKKQIYGIIEWLRFPYEGETKVTTNGSMIVTTKVTQGMLVNICKYSVYQDSKIYEGNSEGNDEGIANGQRRGEQGNNINKNDKNDKNDKEDIVKIIHGEFKKVKLTNTEYEKLVAAIGEKETKQYIVDLDAYIETKKKRYSNHYATIQTWYRGKHPGFSFTDIKVDDTKNKLEELERKAEAERRENLGF